jgi:hypothetical protein
MKALPQGKEIPVDEILSLASGVQALFLVATLESRALAHIKAGAQFIEEAGDFGPYAVTIFGLLPVPMIRGSIGCAGGWNNAGDWPAIRFRFT